METTAALYRRAVAYAVERLEVGADHQQVTGDLLDLDAFQPLRAQVDPDDLLHCISDIMTDADDAVEARRMRNIQPQDDTP